jgi:hypothetical protein
VVKKVVNKRKKVVEPVVEVQPVKNTYLNVLIPCRSRSVEVCTRAKSLTKPVTQNQQQQASSAHQFGSQNHYRLNWGDIPFVVGQVNVSFLYLKILKMLFLTYN